MFVTWRLHGSLPLTILKRLRKGKEPKMGKRFVRFDRELDRGSFGPRWLQEQKIAAIVQREILAVTEESRTVVHSYVLMPNHVYLLIESKVELCMIMKSIKGRSARACNLLLRREGQPFWQQESFDHWIRTADSFIRIQRYIEWNPVSAGLVEKPEQWEWSSARKQSHGL
jgi:putative transposase